MALTGNCHDDAYEACLACAGLAAAPVGEWLCRGCIADGKKVIESVEQKGSDQHNRVTYLVKHWGSDARVWVRGRDFTPGAQPLKRAFLAAARAASASAFAPAARNSLRRL